MQSSPILKLIVFILCFCILLRVDKSFSQVLQQNNTISIVNNSENDYVFRVTNGWRANKGDVPYQVALKSLISRYRMQYATFCGAVLVAPTKLITAAHCFSLSRRGIYENHFRTRRVDRRNFSGKYAVAGNLKNIAVFSAFDSNKNGQWREIFSVYCPKKYDFPLHDIAVAYTKRRFQYNNYVAPIPIATCNTEYAGSCLVSGYGRISKVDKASHLILAHLNIMSSSECSQAHQTNMSLFLCTATKLSDVAKGDSGGPLVCSNTGDPDEGPNGILVGIVSGYRPNAGSFFTRVSEYNKFIETARSNTIHGRKATVILTSLVTLINIYFFLF